MIASLLPTLASNSAHVAASANPTPADPEPQGPGFARLLDQAQTRREQAAPPTPQTPPTTPTPPGPPEQRPHESCANDSTREPAAATETEESAEPADKAQGRQRLARNGRGLPGASVPNAEAGSASLPAAETAAPAADTETSAAAKPARARTAADSEDADAAVMDTSALLARLAATRAAAGAPPAGGATQAGKPPADASARAARDGGRAAAATAAVPAAASSTATAAASHAAAQADAEFAGPVEAGSDQRSFAAELHAALPTAPSAAATASAGHTTATPTAAPPAAHGSLSAPPGSPEFAPELGTQVSTFIRDGVHHAQLELNPADMGPVSVQIQLDGSAAQVTLAAENAETRQALEQAMPHLASSLREAGLTLSGGGVFEQPRQPQGDTAGGERQGNGRSTAAPGGDSADTARTAAAAAPVRRRGVVDLVA